MALTINPFTNKSVYSYEVLTKKMIDEKLIESDRCYMLWKNVKIENRKKNLSQLSKILISQKNLLGAMISQEMGKPIKQSIAEIEKCSLLCDYYFDHVTSFLSGRAIKTDAKESFVTYEPLGVLLGVMPWNFPFWQVFRFAIPSIMAGNTVVMKHASNVMGSAALIEKIFIDAGFPIGVYQNLEISSKEVADIIANPIVKAVSLTGSEGAGSAVAATAGKYLKKTLLELGGSNAFIVCEDADIKKTVAIAVNARMQNAGQSCIAAKRFLVHDKIHDDFVKQFAEAVSKMIPGDPMDMKTEIGTMSRIDLAEELEKQMNTSVKMGAVIATGGKRKDAFFEPTILTHVTPDMPAFNEELFGPIAAVTSFSDFDEAVNLSNQSSFGLGVSIFSADVEFVKTKIHLFNEGAVFINQMIKSDPRLPFGGIKKSGYGRELSEEGIKEFVNIKTVFIAE
ncbi:NAD-dependent succinate-semialdehyde dehydrogenase [Flavobacterium sp. '19STA2R22 D10 B1']|uniref:NAD-dependent succinate-semialdehyde dehydrogenase n=1 Tax=Flavobacterium aerium TaxID=3037261 RepID=UPI00278BF379|nr:NAD-dependent succinate-semialdehyde dehydrogenase [Flavobacterium sp. '19STA2R22 D10 B1']